MQNLKSLDNLLAKPVLGANDDTLAMVGRKKVSIYSYEDETRAMLRKLDEPQRRILWRQMMTDSYQN
jgi:hypothetical protein